MTDIETGLAIQNKSKWYQSYINDAQLSNVSIAEAVASRTWDSFCNENEVPTIFNDHRLERFARKIDGFTKSDWVWIEDTIGKGQVEGTYQSSDRLINKVIRESDNKDKAGLVEYAFQTSGQISYVTNYFGVDPNYHDIQVLESPRLAQATSNAALEIYLRKELDKYGYGFDYLKALTGQEADEFLTDTNFGAWERVKVDGSAIMQAAKRANTLKRRVKIAAGGLVLIPPITYGVTTHPVESALAAAALFVAGMGYVVVSDRLPRNTTEVFSRHY